MFLKSDLVVLVGKHCSIIFGFSSGFFFGLFRVLRIFLYLFEPGFVPCIQSEGSSL